MENQYNGVETSSLKRKFSNYAPCSNFDAITPAPSRRSTDSCVSREDALASLARYREMDRIFVNNFFGGSPAYDASPQSLASPIDYSYPQLQQRSGSTAPAPYNNTSPSSDSMGYDPDHELEFELNTNMGMVWRDVPRPSPPTDMSWLKFGEPEQLLDGPMLDPTMSLGPPFGGSANSDLMFGQFINPLAAVEGCGSDTNNAIEELSSLGSQLQAKAQEQMRYAEGRGK